jgi:hypothetical protein
LPAAVRVRAAGRPMRCVGDHNGRCDAVGKHQIYLARTATVHRLVGRNRNVLCRQKYGVFAGPRDRDNRRCRRHAIKVYAAETRRRTAAIVGAVPRLTSAYEQQTTLKPVHHPGTYCA